jgi:ribosomal protein L9
VCFVKPGYAFNTLVPQRIALFYTDPAAKAFEYNMPELKTKQDMRALELFLERLKDIKLVFNREVSEINKNVAKMPVEAQEVLESLNKRYNMGIKREDFRMEQGLDTIGEHFVKVTYTSEQYKKDFSFFVMVQIRGKTKVEDPKAAKTTTAAAATAK